MEEINLRDFLIYLKKYILVFVAAALVAVGGTFIYNKNFKTPLYTASSSIVLYQNGDSTTTSATLNEINVGTKLVSTYSELIKSELILQQVIDNLNLDMTYAQLNKNVSVSTEDNTMLLTIKVKNANPEKAAEIANKIADVFTKETVKRFGITNISVWGEAKVPNSPSNMTMTRDMLLAGLIAVFGVLAIAFLIFYFDDTVKYTEDIADRVGLPVAGKVVKNDIARKTHTASVHVANTSSDKSTTTSGAKIPSELVVEKHPKAAVSESIKSLRTNLQFTSVDEDLKTILITSSLPGEGKSFVSINLAASFAQTDKKVLLIDCDLRRGRLHKVFDLPNINGLSNLLADDLVSLNRYIQDTGIDNLSVITRGTCPPNPSELLSSQKNKDLIKKLKNKFDIIIFDGTPCNGLTDSIIMSTLVDETLVVVRNAMTPRSALAATKDSLEKVGAKIAGIIPNAIARKTASYYTYYSDDDK